MTGGSGNDVLGFSLNNAASNTAANFGAAGTALIDGSVGIDACTVSGNGWMRRRNCEL